MSWSLDLFSKSIDALPLLDSTIGDRRRSCIETAAALDVTLHVETGVVASNALITDLAAASRQAGHTVQAHVEVGPEHREFGTNPFRPRCSAFAAADPLPGCTHIDHALTATPLGEQAQAPEPTVLPTLREGASRPQPGRMARPIGNPVGDRFIWGVGAWSDLLVANLLALQAKTATENRIDPTATVHPTAVVENSRVRRGCTIGPYAVVRNSSLGEDVEVHEHSSISGAHIGDRSVTQTGSLVHGSVIGPDTVVSFHVAIRGSMLFGNSTISAPVVARSVIGDGVFLARDVAIGGTSLNDRPISIRRGGRWANTGIRLLGCVVGSGARIGNGLQLPAGFVVPAGAYIASRPARAVPEDIRPCTPHLADATGYRSLSLT